MNPNSLQTKQDAARRWRRWLWEAAETGEPRPGVSLADAVFADRDLADLMETNAFVLLIERLVEYPEILAVQELARKLLDEIFPYNCRCRRTALMGRDYISFAPTNVYRSIYFSDTSVTQNMGLLFNRTPELKLLHCLECDDVWLQALDQVEWVQHLVLIEPQHLKKIESDGIWPNTLDGFEDAWTSAFAIVGRNSPDLREWQQVHNTPEAFVRFGK